jgi:pyruvate dehydrogenase E1 component beta subunit
MFGGQANPNVTIRGIINRGGEQGAQHSQALHAWFAHIPGLRVVMPSTVADARDLLIASVLCKDPVMFIDDRWLYDQEDILPPIKEIDLTTQKPIVTSKGKDITIVASGHSSLLAREATQVLKKNHISAEVIDTRVLSPLHSRPIINSVKKTKNLLVVDPGWTSGGFSAEIIAKVIEQLPVNCLSNPPVRIALPDAPAPSSRVLEKAYYTKTKDLIKTVKKILKKY